MVKLKVQVVGVASCYGKIRVSERKGDVCILLESIHTTIIFDNNLPMVEMEPHTLWKVWMHLLVIFLEQVMPMHKWEMQHSHVSEPLYANNGKSPCLEALGHSASYLVIGSIDKHVLSSTGQNLNRSSNRSFHYQSRSNDVQK